MFFIPLNQVESVQLVVNALKMAGGAADCTTCPAHRVCMRQCLSVAATVEKMITDGTLPVLEPESTEVQETSVPQSTVDKKPAGEKRPALKVIK